MGREVESSPQCSFEESDLLSVIIMVLLISLGDRDLSRKGGGSGGEDVLLGWLVSLGRRAGGELLWEEEIGVLGHFWAAWQS